MYGIEDPPVFTVTRTISPEEQPHVQASCMTDQGFPPRSDGAFYAPNEQAAAMHMALYKCTAEYPLDEKYVRPLSDGQLKVVYDYYVGTLAPCLRAQGHDVGAPPTLDTFQSTAGTAAEYSPYAQLGGDVTDVELQALAQDCPALPPADVLYSVAASD